MSPIDAVLEEMRQLPEPKVQQVAALVHQLHETWIEERRHILAASAGCLTPLEADEWQRLIDESCERIDPAPEPGLD